MIAKGRIKNEDRADLNGKPYTFDLDNDFLHLTYRPGKVAFSDYVPRQSSPNEYMIVEFDEDGRVIGFAFEGMLAEWAAKSLKNKINVLKYRTIANTQGVVLATKVVSEFGKIVFDKIPKLDSNGRLPSYAP